MSEVEETPVRQYRFVPYEYARMDEAAQLAASRQFLETMATRRTIR